MKNLSKISVFFSSAIFIFFIFSGLIKWIQYWPIDPTLLFGSLMSIAVFVKCTIIKKKWTLHKKSFIYILLTSIFFLFYIISAGYSISQEYWKEKLQVFLLSPLAFFFPLIVFDSDGHYKYFEILLYTFAFLASTIVIYLYMTGYLEFVLNYGNYKELYRIPNYLGIGVLIGLGFLLAITDFKLISLLYLGISIPALISIGSRGPTLILLFCFIIVFIFSWILNNKKKKTVKLYKKDKDIQNINRLNKSSNKWSKISKKLLNKSQLNILILLFAFIIFIIYWEGSALLIARTGNIFFDEVAMENAFRYDEFLRASEVIIDNTLLGVGIGGYGLAAYGMDINVYPHNIFLESFAEGGFFCFLLIFITLTSILFVPIEKFEDKRYLLYYFMTLFVLLNYMKSGGFVGTRDLFAFFGIYLSYIRNAKI